ncbi:MAG: FAD-dependent oxidoreductase, partial [Actinomadura sp.]
MTSSAPTPTNAPTARGPSTRSGPPKTAPRRRSAEFTRCDHLRDLAVTFRFGESVAAVEQRPGAAITVLESGKKILADTVMYSAGRQGMTGELGLEAAGLTADEGGRIAVDEYFRTPVPHIYAVGDVIGF